MVFDWIRLDMGLFLRLGFNASGIGLEGQTELKVQSINLLHVQTTSCSNLHLFLLNDIKPEREVLA